jgi:hypothetical protein
MNKTNQMNQIDLSRELVLWAQRIIAGAGRKVEGAVYAVKQGVV